MSLLLSPLSWLLLAVLLLLGGQAARRPALRVPGALLLALAWLAMTPLGANWLVGRIEREALLAPGDCGAVEWLVVLGGGLARAPLDEGDSAALTTASLQRVFALAGNPPPPGWRIAVSGGGPHALGEASLMAALLQRLDPALVVGLQELDSQTTWHSAEAMAARLLPPRQIALASSALHLPRARRAFEAAGFRVCLWPLDRQYLEVGGLSAWRPQSSALQKSEAALHELVGDAYYRWLAWRGVASDSS